MTITGPTGSPTTRLLILRRNSGSGKSTLSRRLRQEYGRGLALIEQDYLRRILLRERDKPVGAAADLIVYLDVELEETARRPSRGPRVRRGPDARLVRAQGPARRRRRAARSIRPIILLTGDDDPPAPSTKPRHRSSPSIRRVVAATRVTRPTGQTGAGSGQWIGSERGSFATI